MLKLPAIEQRTVKIEFRSKIKQELDDFICFARENGTDNATTDNVLVYMLDEFFRSKTADVRAFQRWRKEDRQRPSIKPPESAQPDEANGEEGAPPTVTEVAKRRLARAKALSASKEAQAQE